MDRQDYNDLQEYAADPHTGSEAFARLVGRYAGPVYAMCLRQLGDRHLAEDATQAVFMILSKRAARIDVGTLLPGWLFQTARYVCANAHRARTRREFHEREASEMRTHSDSGIGEMELILDDALASLRKRDRSAILLRYVQGLTTAEVASRMSLSEEAARKCLSRSIERLRAYFARRGMPIEQGAIAAIMAPLEGLGTQPLVAGILKACAMPGQAAVAATLAKGAIAAMQVHLLKTGLATAACAGLGVIGLVAGASMVVSMNRQATASAPAALLQPAGAAVMQGTAEPSVDEAQRLAAAGDWSGAIDTYSEYLRGLTAEQYRDKKDFGWILEEYERVRRPRGEAGYREFSEIIQRKLEERAPGDPDRWRLYRALAGIDEKLRDPRSQREHLEQAIDEYPPDLEGNPAQHSSIQHLYNSIAMLIAATSMDEAEKYLLDSYEQDPRFVCVFLPPWQQLFKDKNQAARYDRLVEQVLAAYQRKADREPSLRRLLEEYSREARSLKR